ncbi:MAG: hypothetical protein EA387_04160 [Nitriliruptor sp.]|nr:MAG: hypothetical protein EA387_04160 [Nitriliruptor sp.]
MKPRRRDTATSSGLPVELRRFVFADWHDPADAVVDTGGAIQAGTPVHLKEQHAMLVILRARRRFSEARQAWADEHGLHLRDLPSILGPVVDRP